MRSTKRSAILISSAGWGVAGHTGAWQCLRTRAERALHQHRVNPTAELEPDRREDADVGKAQRFVQADRGDRLAATDHGDHLAVAEFGAAFDQGREQPAADPAPHFAGIDIDRVLERVAVANSGTARTA